MMQLQPDLPPFSKTVIGADDSLVLGQFQRDRGINR
jgi:hypothetical protein